MKKGAKHLWTCVAICWFASVVSSDQMKRAKLKSIKDAEESHIDNEQKYPRQELVVEPKSRNTAEYLPEESYKEEQSTAAASGGYASRETQQINRIIGGGEVKNGRYPYIASLTKERSHVCGGSLIADDIILSAAHCGGHFDGVDVGRHDLDDKTEEMERYNVEKFLIHPQYKDASGSFDNDFMVIKLYGWSEFDTVRLNFNPNVPSAFEELYVAGWGVISTTTQETADKLKEVSVNYMTNEECKNKKGYVAGFSQIYSFQNKITDNMMCAIDVGEDACQGDSGGPLILKKASPQFDVQVGVVSWGLGCADPIFPGIYSRVSNQYQWIRDLVCSWAEKPPPFYACTPKQERPENPKRAVTLEIRLDRFPKETGWLIRSQYGKTNSYVATGRYSAYTGSSYQQKLVTTTVRLEEDTKYDLIMLDSYGDGLKFDGGYYKLWLGDAPYMGIQLVSGSVYGKFMKHPFYVPKSVATEQPIKAPSSPPQSLPPANAPTSIDVDDTPFLTIGFKFDKYPEQIGWAITSIETRKLLISKPFGSYTGKKNSLVFEKFTLPDPSTALSDQYIFAVLDSGRDGLCCENGQGFFQVFYGEMSDNNVMFRGGTFSYLDQFIFQLDGSVITSPPVYSPLRIDGGDQNPTDGPNPWGDDDTSKGTDSKCPQNLYSFAVAIGILSFSLL